MSFKIILVVAGLLVGAALGWFTAPKPDVQVQAGGVNLSVDDRNGAGGGSMTVTGKDGKVMLQVGEPSTWSDPGFRTAIFAAIGVVIGFGVGYLVDMRKG